MAQLRLGVVGLGVIGRQHLDYFPLLQGAVLGAVCDLSAERARQEGEARGVPHYADPEAMMAQERLDGVLVLTDHFSHCPIALAAFARGLHVLCEKPITVRLSDGRRMVAEAERRGLVLGVGFSMRASPHYPRLKELIGGLGRILRADLEETCWLRTMTYYRSSPWRGTWAGEGGGILLNQAPHRLDLLHYLFGLPESVHANLAIRHHDIEVEDDVGIFMRFPAGFALRYSANTWEAPGVNRLYVVGEQGSVCLDDQELRSVRYEQSILDYIRVSPETIKPPVGQEERETLQCLPHSSQYVVAQSWVDCILGKRPAPLVSGQDALGSLQVANAALVSHFRKAPVQLDQFDPAEFDRLLERLAQKEIRL